MNILWRHILATALVLGSFRGFLALYDPGQPEPRYIYPYSVASLPETDRQALEEGIRVVSEEELSRLLEDFLS